MDPKRKIILIFIGFGVILLIAILFGIYPLLKGIKERSEQVSETKKEIISFDKNKGEGGQIEKIYKDLEPDLKKANQLFVDPEVPIDFIKFLEDTGKNSGVSVEISSGATSSLKEKTKEKWNSIEFQIKLLGYFPEILRFIKKIETGPYLIEIQSLNIQKSNTGFLKEELSVPGDIKASLTIKVFTK